MQSKVESNGPCAATINITIEPSDLRKAADQRYRKLAREVNLPGFRKGKVPRSILEKKFGDGVKAEIRELVLNRALGEVFKEHSLTPVEQPSLDIDKLDWDSGNDIEVSFEIEVRPQIELEADDYKGILASVPVAEISSADIDREIDGLRHNLAEMEDVGQGPIGPEDLVTIDVTYRFVDGSTLPIKENAVADMRDGTFDGFHLEDLQGFFVGKMVDDQVRIPSITLPETFSHEESRGRVCEAETTIRSLRRITLPEVDEAFFEKLGVESEEDLRTRIEESLEHSAKHDSFRQIEEYCIDFLLDRHTIPVPEKMQANTLKGRMEDMRMQMTQAGMEEVEIQRRLVEAEKPATEGVEKGLRIRFLLDRIVELEGIRVSEDDLKGYLSAMAQSMQRNPMELFEELQESGALPGLVEEIARQKGRKLLREHAETTDPSTEEDSSQADEPSEDGEAESQSS